MSGYTESIVDLSEPRERAFIVGASLDLEAARNQRIRVSRLFISGARRSESSAVNMSIR